MNGLLLVADAGLAAGFSPWWLASIFLAPVHVLIAFWDGRWGVHATVQTVLVVVVLPFLIMLTVRRSRPRSRRIANIICVYVAFMVVSNFLIRLIFG